MDKKKAPLDTSGWELIRSDPRQTPQQGNGSDCGCFASAFAYLMGEGIPFKYVRACVRARLVLGSDGIAEHWGRVD